MTVAFVYALAFLFVSLTSKWKLLGSLLFGVFFGLSYQLGHADYISYTSLYLSICAADYIWNAEYIFGHYEPLYVLLQRLGCDLGLQYYDVRFFMYTASYYLFLMSLDRLAIKEKPAFIALFLCLVGFSHLFSADRQAIAVLLTLPCIAFFGKAASFLPVGFHYSAGIIWSKYLFRLKKLDLVAVLILLAIPAIFLLSKYSYFFDEEGFEGISISSILLLIAMAFELKLSFNDNEQVEMLRKYLKVCIFLAAMTLVIPAVFYRLKAYFIVVVLATFYSRVHENRMSYLVRTPFVFLIVLLVAFAYVHNEPLGFDPYQNVLLLDNLKYPDKSTLWQERFKN